MRPLSKTHAAAYPLSLWRAVPHPFRTLPYRALQDPTLDQFSLPGCRLELHAGPHTLLRDCFFVSGAIPRVTSFETGQPGHATLGVECGGGWGQRCRRQQAGGVQISAAYVVRVHVS